MKTTKRKIFFIENMWIRAIAVDGVDSALYRQDACGAWIKKDDYKNPQSEFGWGVDQICGTLKKRNKFNIDKNLRPLNLKNIKSKKESYKEGRYYADLIAHRPSIYDKIIAWIFPQKKLIKNKLQRSFFAVNLKTLKELTLLMK